MMFLFARNWFDERLNTALAHVTKLWVKVTGKNNFALFRHAFVLALFCQLGTLAWMVVVKGEYILAVFVAFSNLVFWFPNAWKVAKRLRFIADRVLAGEPIYIADAWFLREACFWRCYMLSFSILMILVFALFRVPFTVASNIPIFPLGLSLYFASHFTGGGTSVLDKAKEKLKSLAESVNLKPATIGA